MHLKFGSPGNRLWAGNWRNYWWIVSGITFMSTGQWEKWTMIHLQEISIRTMGCFKAGMALQKCPTEVRGQGVWTSTQPITECQLSPGKVNFRAEVPSGKGLSYEPDCELTHPTGGMNSFILWMSLDVTRASTVMCLLLKRYEKDLNLLQIHLWTSVHSHPFISIWHILQYLICIRCHAECYNKYEDDLDICPVSKVNMEIIMT